MTDATILCIGPSLCEGLLFYHLKNSYGRLRVVVNTKVQQRTGRWVVFTGKRTTTVLPSGNLRNT